MNQQIPPETVTTQHLLLKLKVMAVQVEDEYKSELVRDAVRDDLRQLAANIERVTDGQQFYAEDICSVLDLRGEKQASQQIESVARLIAHDLSRDPD